MSSWCKKAFEVEAFAERIAHTLNFVLKSLVGPEGSEIQVKDPDTLNFKPVQLLDDLAFIYTNLSHIEFFCKSVVRDERSFKIEYLN